MDLYCIDNKCFIQFPKLMFVKKPLSSIQCKLDNSHRSFHTMKCAVFCVKYEV